MLLATDIEELLNKAEEHWPSYAVVKFQDVNTRPSIAVFDENLIGIDINTYEFTRDDPLQRLLDSTY